LRSFHSLVKGGFLVALDAVLGPHGLGLFGDGHGSGELAEAHLDVGGDERPATEKDGDGDERHTDVRREGANDLLR
jgi:hypothetical protein